MKLIREIGTIIIGFIYVRKDKIGRAFLAYLCFDFTMLVIFFLLKMSPYNADEKSFFFTNITNGLISLVELNVYYYYFKNILQNKTVVKFLSPISLSYSLLYLLFILTRLNFINENLDYVSKLICAIEFVLIIIPCLYYYIDLLKSASNIPLFDRPSFWITTGILFYASISIPYYLISSILYFNKVSYFNILYITLFILPFSINFIFLARAFLCKRNITF